MAGEYSIKVTPIKEKNWSNSKLLEVTVIINMKNKNETFYGLVSR